MIKTPKEAALKLFRAFLRCAPAWLADEAAASAGCGAAQEDADFPLERPLGRVTETEAAHDLADLKRLCGEWRRWGELPGWTVTWSPVRWRRLGVEAEVPVKVSVDSAAALLRALYPLHPEDVPSPEVWNTARRRLLALIERFAPLENIPPAERQKEGRARIGRLAKALWSRSALNAAVFTDEDFRRLVDLAAWLIENPDSGLFVREIPVEGVDTKWFEARRWQLFRLWNFAQQENGREGASSIVTFFRVAGMREKPFFVRVRHAQHWTGGDPEDVVQLTLERLASNPSDSPVVLIIENEQTGLSVEAPESVPILIGLGYGVCALRNIPWLAERRILYFGDIDTHGLAILAECRRMFPQTESVLMNRSVWKEWRRLAAFEPVPAAKRPAELTPEEAALYDELSAVQGRLEQERIPLAAVNHSVEAALTQETAELLNKR